ncbi:MATE family efflux transporter [Corynebacterium hansenii]|uniref:Probable multidrug resistance protein NorM n=1 Tax=Corynebacterium hansenii TaxID=394964 RepID=A0ABV7ZM98_9CORY|nr:MATE family efflux transporter [Corynebacterium hansenii]WJY98909.1 Multidrug resistance protein MdtK [Corynebacterium hansenii]
MSSAPAATPPGSLRRQLVALAAPIAGTQLAQIALSTTDTAMMGLLGVEALAGGGLAVVIFNQVRTMGVGLVVPLGNQVAAADSSSAGRDRVRAHVRAGFLVATVAALVGALAIVGIGALLPFLGQPGGVVDAARPMLWALAPGLLPCLWFQVIRQFTVGMRRPRGMLGITVASIAVNAALNLALIHGWGPFPVMGLAGIGASTSVVHAAVLVAFWAVVRRDDVLAPCFSPAFWWAAAADVRSLARLGVPVSATYASEAGMFSVLAFVMGSISATALAAHNVVYQVTFIVFQLAIGFSHASSILVSRQTGSGDAAGALAVMRLALGHMLAAVVISGVFYAAAPELVLAPFLGRDGDPATVSLAASLLLIGVVMQFADSAQNIGLGLLRGLGDTVSGFRLSVVGYWIVGLPAALALAFGAHLGAAGVWWGLTLGLATTAVLMLRHFRRSLRDVSPRDVGGSPADA